MSMKEKRAESKRSRAEVAYLSLRRAIIEQALEPGTKLPENEIGSVFEMSRTLVREVLTNLKNDGLVDIEKMRSATIARPSLTEAHEVFRVRKCLEREVVRQICQRWNNKMETALDKHIKLENAAVKEDNHRLSIRLAGEFHILLAELSGNFLLKKYVNEVVSRCSLILGLYARPHSSQCAVTEHRELIKIFSLDDVEKATELMDEHVGLVEQRALILEDSPVKLDVGSVIENYAKQINSE
jgi:DNA-binding GntR family transcriptional regulator